MSQSQDETGDVPHVKSRSSSDHQGQTDLSKHLPIDKLKADNMLPDSAISSANVDHQAAHGEQHDDDDLEALVIIVLSFAFSR